MATLVLSAAGGALGASMGSSVLGLGSAVLGRAVGAGLGRMVDQRLMGAGSAPVDVGKVDRFRLTGAGEGAAIPQAYGRVRLPGQVIWASEFRSEVTRSGGGGGKAGAAQPETRQHRYYVSLALGLCEGTVARIGRIWADGREIMRDRLDLVLYEGGEDQEPDPTMQAHEGVDAVPAYRGLAYVVIRDLDLSAYGNRIPQFNFEIIRPEQADAEIARDLAHHVRGVALLPGSGEYALATTPVSYRGRLGEARYANVNTPGGGTDMSQALEALADEVPNCKTVVMVVSWFGDDLRCGQCRVEPMVEQREGDGHEMPWNVAGLSRDQAKELPKLDGGAVYEGTPSDASVVEAIRAMRQASGPERKEVVFYPFLLMTQLAGNGRADPYGAASEQPALPWRGRITLSQAPGQPDTPDRTLEAEAQVSAFFEGTASYRRFILHYAHLCAEAGGVDAFCVGSELRGLTQIRGADGFPAVEQLRSLAREVRDILPQAKIGYAADWSEYFGYHPQDGSGDVYFHLDPLWADDAVDFVGIDNYMPLSDWREGGNHADAEWGSIYDLDYLKSNILGGEGYDWFYASQAASEAQDRTPITDGAHGEPWVYRYKDLPSWWSNPHHERIGGTRRRTPTDWVPKSKPIWFTELGCAAIDKGTNQPNKFLDPKSSESRLPHYSAGHRDDYIQVQYLRAMDEFWGEGTHNPVSPIYGGRMVDRSRAHVWAWDARPFPYFPGRSGVWSDAANYPRGHWITGRTGSRTLASVIAEICARSGVLDVDVEELHGIVRGYTVTELTDARAALQPLMLAHGVDATERDGRIVFRQRSARASTRLDPAAFAVADEVPGDLVATREPEAEGVGRMKLNFVSADRDFTVQTVEAAASNAVSPTVSQSETAVVMTEGEAQAVVDRWLAETRVARDRAKFALPPSRSDVGAGDVVAFGDDTWRVDRVERSDVALIEAVRMEPGLYDQAPRDASDLTVPDFVAPTPVVPVLLDLPLLTGEEVPHAPHIAVTARRWDGPVAVFSSETEGGGDTRQELLCEARSVIGETLSEMRWAPAGIWDRGPALRVEVVAGSLSSVPPGALLSGANAMAIGSGEDDLWEVFQFREAVPAMEDRPNVYDISGRLRGQAGTDGVMPRVWPKGSRVVLLDGTERQVPLRPALRDVAREYRIGPASRPYDDPSYVRTVRSFAGVGLRPYAPVHLRARRVPGGVDVTWIRRTRLDGDGWSGLDVPLGEEREAYEVTVRGPDGSVLRREIVEEARWRYEGAGPVTVEVAQISARWGAGPARKLALG